MPRAHVPPGFARQSADGATLVLREDLADRLTAAGLARPAELRARAHATYAGRGEPFAIEVPDVGPVFVRPYLHGGLLRRMTADRHAGDGRFLDELAVLVAARSAGVPVCEPLGIVSRPAAVGLRRGWLLVREESGARDVLAVLGGGVVPRDRRDVLAAAGRAIRALHDAGFAHPDLHFKNLLWTADGRVLILDLDRATAADDLPRARRIAELFRFDRYGAKRAALGDSVTRTDRLRVLRAYAGTDWPARAELRELASRLRAHITRHGVLRRSAQTPGAGVPS